ncbi:MAG: pyridoxamine 5'-phosphate oxidase family protein [Hyphomicrobiaceae bacterium]
MTTDPRTDCSPFHPGERRVQEIAGARDIEAWARKVVRDHLPEQHRDFHTSLPFLVVAARDAAGRPWVTLLEGADGFIASPDPRSLVIRAKPAPGDALENAFNKESDIGILGIELSTRRRNRLNGRISELSPEGFSLTVDQTFGNCPQYIREREWHRVEDTSPGQPRSGRSLTPSQREWIRSADTFFIASGYRAEGESPAFGMDASHRGGERGFVEVLEERKLRFPDYAGNNHFNTIGNLLLDPRAGCLFVDFETGTLLQLTGMASVDWTSDALARFPGARRLVTFDIDEIVELPAAVGLRWDSDAQAVRSLRLTSKIRESDDVTSLVFEARDGGPLASFEPGQHLPIELATSSAGEVVRRTYSLSNGPSRDQYRISVKREPNGLASRYLHDLVEPGAIIESRRPAGEFMMTCNKCPLVLVSAGVGITPMLSILQSVAREKGDRPVWFVHGARNGRHHPFASEVRDFASMRHNIKVHVAYTQPERDDAIGVNFDSAGRIDGTLLARLVGSVDAHYFVCGPAGFMSAIHSDLEDQNVPLDRIHTESFGPAG